MNRPAYLLLVGEAINPTQVLVEASQSGRLLALTGDFLLALVDELGGEDVAFRYLTDLTTAMQRPIALNFDTGEETSSTALIGPIGWSNERVQGWLAGMLPELEAAFGPATPHPV